MDLRSKSRSAKKTAALEEPTISSTEKKTEPPVTNLKRSMRTNKKLHSERSANDDEAELHYEDQEGETEKKKVKRCNQKAEAKRSAVRADKEKFDDMDDEEQEEKTKERRSKRLNKMRNSGRTTLNVDEEDKMSDEEQNGKIEREEPIHFNKELHPAVEADGKTENEQKEIDEERQRELDLKVAECAKLLASMKPEKGKKFSNEAFDTLFLLLGGDPNRKECTDESLVSEIDTMSDTEIKRRDEAFRKTMQEIREIPKTQERLLEFHRFIEKTKEEKDAYWKQIRDDRHRHLSKAARDQMEKRRTCRIKKLEEKMATVIPLHLIPCEQVELSCRQFSYCLEQLSDFIKLDVDPASAFHMEREVDRVPDEEIQKVLRTGVPLDLPKSLFEKEEALAKCLKANIRQILNNKTVFEIFGKEHFGFQFGTYQTLKALSIYYSDFSEPRSRDFSITLRNLVKASYLADRETTKKTDCLHPIIHYCLQGDSRKIE